MMGWVDDWGDSGRGDAGMVSWVDDWGEGGRGDAGMVGWVDDWGEGGGGEVGMVGWVDDWGGSGREEVGRGESGRDGASGEGVRLEFCALASDGRVLNATAASSRTGNS